MKIVALICARGNSRGIKNKNLLKFKKTTLLGNAIKQALGSKYINQVIVSTDSNKIAREAIKNKAEAPFVRPSKLAKDNSPEIICREGNYIVVISNEGQRLREFSSLDLDQP